MNQPRARLCASICQRGRVVVIAADDFGGFGHVTTRRANRRKIHHNRIFCNTFNDTLVGKVSHHELATFVIKPVLNPVKIQIDTEHAPLGTRQYRIEKMATNKTTAANYGHGDTRIVEPRVHYFLTVNLPEFAPFLESS